LTDACFCYGTVAINQRTAGMRNGCGEQWCAMMTEMLDGGVRQGSCVGGRQNDFRIWALSLDLQTDSLTFMLFTHSSLAHLIQFALTASNWNCLMLHSSEPFLGDESTSAGSRQ
jgi:hypothetical protein